MTDVDVAVVGMGLAGATAGLAAARHRPAAAVRLVPSTAPGFGDGLLRVFARGPTGEHPLADPFPAVDAVAETHPYQLLGPDALRDGIELFDDVTGGEYCGSDSHANSLVPTGHGRVTPAARYPAAMAPGLVSREERMLLVGFDALPDMKAPLAATRLREARVPFDVHGVTVRFPIEPSDDAPAEWIARELDANRAVDGEPLRAALADRVRPHTATTARVGFPAVLGRTASVDVHAALDAALDVDIFEVPLPEPRIPGRRLRDRFEAALADAGVTYEPDDRVTRATLEAGERPAVTLASGESIRAGAVVLATGGPAAGGIVADRGAVTEPLFDCHVPHPDHAISWSDPAPFGDHAFARFGVRIDAEARPVGPDGAPEHDCLFAAGGIVGGHDFVDEGSQGGVALVTGTTAGRRAAER